MKRMMIFHRRDTPVFGKQTDSFSTDRNPGVQWEIGDVGVRLTMEKDDDLIEEIIPWSNVAKLQTTRSKAEAKNASPLKK